MRKVFIFLMTVALTVMFASCGSCDRQKAVDEPTVEQFINADKDYMTENYGKDYTWYESSITLNTYLDWDCDLTVTAVTNVFQVVTQVDEDSYDSKVILITHYKGETLIDEEHGFWVEDNSLNNEIISVTFNEALERINEANYPKPHSNKCVLRNQIGPVAANAQYIFGNAAAQLYVDVMTGDVTDKNPWFLEEEVECEEEVEETVE